MDLICGINPVIEALTSGSRHFDRLLIVKGIRNRRVSDAIARASQMGVPLRFEARETLDRMAGGLPHQGIIAVVSAKPAIGLEDLIRTTRDPGLLVVLDGVEDPRNLGAILRTVEASGADGVLLPERHSAGLSETVGRASAGAIEHVRVARIGNVNQALETLKSRGYWIVGFDGSATERWDAIDYRRPVALVFGGEGRGIRRLVKEHCDHLVSLPLFGHIQSLNVSVAAGVALYEVVRQRGAVPSHVRPIPIRPASAKQIIGPSPDDAEHDPGVVPPVLDGHVDDLEEDPIRFVHIEEQDASGPTVIKHAVERRQGNRDERRRFGRRQGRGRGADRDRGGERPAGAEARQAPSESGNGSGNPASDNKSGGPPVHETGEQGQARRRRRRKRRGGGPAVPAGPQGGAQSQQTGGAETRSSIEGGAGVPSGDGAPGTGTPGRRRRRRRRRR